MSATLIDMMESLIWYEHEHPSGDREVPGSIPGSVTFGLPTSSINIAVIRKFKLLMFGLIILKRVQGMFENDLRNPTL